MWRKYLTKRCDDCHLQYLTISDKFRQMRLSQNLTISDKKYFSVEFCLFLFLIKFDVIVFSFPLWNSDTGSIVNSLRKFKLHDWEFIYFRIFLKHSPTKIIKSTTNLSDNITMYVYKINNYRNSETESSY